MHSFTSELLHWDLAERAGAAAADPAGAADPAAAAPERPPPPDDADSSGDSDDTVIEDAAVPAGSGGGGDVPARDGVPPERQRPDGAGAESFAAFMRECLHAGGRAPEQPHGDGDGDGAARDLEQERLTIRALRELGEEPPVTPPEPPVTPPAPAGPPPPLAELLAALPARELLLWRDARRTAPVFGASLALLLSLAAFSAVAVAAHLLLALLAVTIGLRLCRAAAQALRRADDGHPFRAYLERDVSLSPEAFRACAAAALAPLNRGLRCLRRLFLVEDLVDSLKLAVVMWLMTYVGAVFNGITLLILAELLLFTVPPVYEKYKTQIDGYVGTAREQSRALAAKIQAKLPGLAKKKPE